ncbi:MAG: hypothetical protein JW932_17145 [Deltaproteobacteria bacterium]|nr:hypothetical protein [Deltaproteobacteria bacterium]
MMMQRLLIFLAVWLAVNVSFATSAEETSTKKEADVTEPASQEKPYPKVLTEREIIEQNLEPSYITAGGGLNFSFWRESHIDWGDSIFEAELNHHLHFFDSPEKWKWQGFVKFNPKIQIRMSSDKSTPIKTPGFLPRATYFFWFNDKDPHDRFTYYSLMLSHHSNGQAGEFYNSDGTVNTESGNFSTNYLELANYQFQRKYLPEWTKFSVIWHPGFNREDGLDDQYEELKVQISTFTTTRTLRTFKPIAEDMLLKRGWYFKIFTSVSYTLMGRDYVVAPNRNYTQITPQKAEWDDNINLSMTMCVRPPYFNDMNFFVRYDLGYDYYNINFQKEINRIQIGIAGDPFGLLN